MKSLIKLFLLLALLLGVAGVVLGLVFYYSPSLQRNITLRALDQAGDAESQLEYLRVSAGGIELRGLKVAAGGESVVLGEFRAAWDFWSLFGDAPEITTIEVKGLDVDIAASGGAELAAAFASKGDVGHPAEADEWHTTAPQSGTEAVPVRIGRIALDGRLRLPAGRDVALTASMTGLAPGATAESSLNLRLSDTGEGAVFAEAVIDFTGTLSQSDTGIPEEMSGDVTVRLRETGQDAWLETRFQPRFTGSATAFTATVDKVDLAMLSRLPVLGLGTPLVSGLLDLHLKGSGSEPLVMEGSLALTELRPEGYAGKPFAIHLDPKFEADEQAGTVALSAAIRLTAPATLTSGALEATLDTSNKDQLRFNVEAEADALYADEWQPLFALLPQEAEPAVERDPTPDSRAPWAGLEGSLRAQLGKLRVGNDVFSEIVVTAQIQDGQSVATSFSARSGASPVKVDALVEFDAGKTATPYTLRGNLAVQQFDVTPFLKTADARQPVILEGVFNAAGSFQSTAPNLAFIADGLTGGLQVTSVGNGVFRPLGKQTGVASGVSGLLGALTGSVRELGWVQQVIDQLKEIPYTRMSFSVGRDASLNFTLSDLDLVSRETRIRGSGIIQYTAGADLLSLPMDLRFQIFGKGKLAEALRVGKQLRSEQPDDLGFLPGPPLPIRGSLAQPESLLVNLLMESGTQLLPGLLSK